mgnify:CR=1 FL=1
MTETSAELGDYLLAEGVSGRRVAVQHHGSGADGLDVTVEATHALPPLPAAVEVAAYYIAAEALTRPGAGWRSGPTGA